MHPSRFDPNASVLLRHVLSAGIGLLLALAACSQPTLPSTPAENDDIAITVDPATATLRTGESASFTATVLGTDDTNVTWTTTCGTLTGDGTTITYTAPNDTGTCTLTATSQADPNANATATISVEVTAVSITIDPADAEAFPTQTRTFTAAVVGTSDTAVTWELAAGCGDIAPSGNTVTFTATFDAIGSDCSLTATSAADGTQRAIATITIHAPPHVSFEASPNPVSPGTPVVFAWSLTNPSRALSLTCEISTLGDGASFTYTIEACGDEASASTQTHTFTSPGNYGAALRVLQGSTELRSVNLSVRVRRQLVHVSSRGGHSLGLDSEGKVWAWGRNSFGQLGDGTTTNRSRPVPVCVSGSTDTDCVQFRIGVDGTLGAATFGSLAMDGEGRVWAWGRNTWGDLGDGTTIDRLNPVPVCASGSTGNGCEQLRLGSRGALSTGGSHTLAVDSSGFVWAWGRNVRGQLGDGTTTDRSNPVPVCISGSTGDACVQLNVGARRALTVGNLHSAIVDGAGFVWAWGRNDDGQLGDGTTTDRRNPVPVCISGSSGDACVQLNVGASSALSAGSLHTLALDSAGFVWAWGDNSNRQLGDGTTTRRSTPVPVCASGSTGNACQPLDLGANATISAGAFHSLALTGSGETLAWGRNVHGQLGDGTIASRGNPVPVCASGSTGNACEPLVLGPSTTISAGGFHSLALTDAGSLLAWGLNADGQLGDGTTTNHSIPVRVPLP